jgi:hypothetical protein
MASKNIKYMLQRSKILFIFHLQTIVASLNLVTLSL